MARHSSCTGAYTCGTHLCPCRPLAATLILCRLEAGTSRSPEFCQLHGCLLGLLACPDVVTSEHFTSVIVRAEAAPPLASSIVVITAAAAAPVSAVASPVPARPAGCTGGAHRVRHSVAGLRKPLLHKHLYQTCRVHKGLADCLGRNMSHQHWKLAVASLYNSSCLSLHALQRRSVCKIWVNTSNLLTRRQCASRAKPWPLCLRLSKHLLCACQHKCLPAPGPVGSWQLQRCEQQPHVPYLSGSL